MLPVPGRRMTANDLPNYYWNADLINFDGPLLSLFKRESGQDSLFVWVDCDERRHRWCIVDVTRSNLRDYLDSKIPLLNLFEEAGTVYLFDQAERRSNVKSVRVEDLPEDYRPSEDSFLTEEISTPAAKAFVSEKVERYNIKLDGELYIDDLAIIPRIYQQLYSFHYGMEHLDRDAVKTELVGNLGKWRGGINAVNLFGGLDRVTPVIHRARLVSLQYNSPGYIALELLPKVAGMIRGTAEALATEEAHKAAVELYDEVYDYLKRNSLSGFEDEDGAARYSLTAQQRADLQDFIAKFMEVLEWRGYQEKFNSLALDPLQRLRAVLAYFRRLNKLLPFQRKGLIAFS